MQILLAGRSQQDVQTIATALTKEAAYSVDVQLVSDDQIDPLDGLASLPDALILVISSRWQEELGTLAAKPAALRPPVVIIGKDDPAAMRIAMRAGARDFLTQPISYEELNSSLQGIDREKITPRLPEQGKIITLLNAKGGSGATFIASNLAYLLAVKSRKKTALLDLDIQFGAQAINLDLNPKHDVVEALKAVDELDAVALEGYMTKYKQERLHLLAAPINRLVLLGETPAHNLSRLLTLISQTYSCAVIDLPHLIDTMAVVALERADTVVIVMQQILAAMRDTKRLIDILRKEIGVSDTSIIVVANRYDPKHPIHLEDIRESLQQPVISIPSDYACVEAATNEGTPLLELAPNAAITRALLELAAKLGDEFEMQPKEAGLLNRALSLFSGKKRS